MMQPFTGDTARQDTDSSVAKYRKVLLIHQGFIQHYRVAIYNYLADYLMSRGYMLGVVSSSVQTGCPHVVNFDFVQSKMTFKELRKVVSSHSPDAVILFVNLTNLYLFPLIAYCKLSKFKLIYWGHGRNLADKDSWLKNTLYKLEHSACDALVLYAEHLRKYISTANSRKVFIANNTLNLSEVSMPSTDKSEVLRKYGLVTRKHILFVGRLQKRKKLDLLLEAFGEIRMDDVGLVIVGPIEDADVDTEGYNNVYKLGPLYGDELFELMSAMDVYCMPGWVGLSIVDAFFMGLPLVTLEGDHPPEIGYLKDGVNGFLIPSDDKQCLVRRLSELLGDDTLRKKMSGAAKREYRENAQIEKMCEGFYQALEYSLGSSNRRV